MNNKHLVQLAENILKSPTFQKRLGKIQFRACNKRLSLDSTPLSKSDIRRLLLHGSVLALSSVENHRKISQQINAFLYELYSSNQTVSHAIQILSSRIGNYPVISKDSKVFGKYNLVKELRTGSDTITIDLETLDSLSVEEKQAKYRISNKTFYFNEIQKTIITALEKKLIISFSAPTSFGKSFIIRHYLAKLFSENQVSKVLIVVPTKSLIDDFYDSLYDLKLSLSLDYSIHTHVRSLNDKNGKAIFILTQERLSFLIVKAPEYVKAFDVVYCDEAQYISRGYRGFVLKNALDNVVSLVQKNSKELKTKFIFSSPLIKNPEYFSAKFFENTPKNKTYHKQITYSPVEKNIHFIAKQKNHYNIYLLKDSLTNESFDERLINVWGGKFIADRKLSEKIGKDIYRDIEVVISTRLIAQNILYVPSPLKAHKYAQALYEELVNEVLIENSDLIALKVYIEEHYDTTFELLKLVKKGIGLHYGKMPVGLRRAIVDLFERGVIKYLICTSTLLEGVNLPAKNIFIFSRLQGMRQEHTTLSFWNLIGRAGRLTYGLSGNVFCISDKPSHYQSLFENTEASVTDPEDEVVNNRTNNNYLVRSLLDQTKKFDYLKARRRADIEYLIFEIFRLPNPNIFIQKLGIDKINEVRLAADILSTRDSFQIPAELLIMNPGIDPRQQNELYLLTLKKPPELIQELFAIISKPRSIKKKHFIRILNSTSKVLNWPIKKDLYDNIAPLAGRLTQWIHEVTISQFIQQSLKYHNNLSRLERIERALNIVDNIDTELSYNAPKYIKCLLDIYASVARTRKIDGYKRYPDVIDNFLYSIESGICNQISKYLFELGVSRPVAIKVCKLLEDVKVSKINNAFFNRREVRKILINGLSPIAYKELNNHIA